MKLQLTTIDDFYTDKEDKIFLGEWCFDSLENTKNFKINNYHYKNYSHIFHNNRYYNKYIHYLFQYLKLEAHILQEFSLDDLQAF